MCKFKIVLSAIWAVLFGADSHAETRYKEEETV
jgi:hypothetical protein